MKDNTRVTITFKQLKRLIRESKESASNIEPRISDKWSIVATKGNCVGKFLSYDYEWGSHAFDSSFRKILIFKSRKGAEDYINGVSNLFALKSFCDERGAKIVPSPFRCIFYASGNGRKREVYANWDELMSAAQEIAADHGGKVEDWGDIVVTADGQEIARWEIL